MKGIVLAGGTGSRLRPITHTGPKQLVPVANKPVIEYAIDDLVEAGITEIGVVLGNKGRQEIQNYLGDGSDFGVEITYIVQGEPLGLAHAVGCAKDFVGDDSFVVYLGDDLMREGIVEFVDDFDPDEYAAGIGLQQVDEPERYGIVEVEDPPESDGTDAGGDDTADVGDVVGLVEKPDDPPSDLALIGIYVFTPAIFEQIERLEPSWRGELEITEAIQGLIDDGDRIQSHVVHGWWKDTGKPEDVIHANRLVLDDIAEGSVQVLDGTLPVEDVPDARSRADVRVVESPTPDYYMIGINARRHPLSNYTFRSALGRLIDRDAIVESVFDGVAAATETPLHQTQYVSEDLEWDGQSVTGPFPGENGNLDAEAARQLFRDAGFRYHDGTLRGR